MGAETATGISGADLSCEALHEACVVSRGQVDAIRVAYDSAKCRESLTLMTQ